jgi:hypothetical protein
MTGKELTEKNWKRQTDYNNLIKYHNLGFKGKGIVVLNAESASDHRVMTSQVLKDYAPDVTLLESPISARTSSSKLVYAKVTINGETLELEQAIDKYNIKIITCSRTIEDKSKSSDAVLEHLRDLQKRKGIIVVCCSGNDGEYGLYAKDNTAITVSAINFRADGTIRLAYYGSVGEIDFANFMARGSGSSAAAPALAGIIALLLSRYGDFNQVECAEILKSISKNLGDSKYYGYGVPILPLADKLEILEEIRKENPIITPPIEKEEDMTTFKDIEETRWSKEAIDFCVEKGLLVGFEDGTFRPTEFVTREQMAIILQRILNL